MNIFFINTIDVVVRNYIEVDTNVVISVADPVKDFPDSDQRIRFLNSEPDPDPTYCQSMLKSGKKIAY